jgi:uncharacterized protein YbbC (DUF1343 family)
MKTIFVTLLFISFSLFAQTTNLQVVKTGDDLLFEKYHDLVRCKRIGLVTNHSAVLSNGKHLADALSEDKDVKLVALFGPEHGIRGDAPDGKSIQHGVDPKTGVNVYSLYGKITKPTDEMLKDVDVLMYDIQDVGARFYTFISTLFLTMESAAEHDIPFIVLDRPNPIRGTEVEGPIRDDSLKSFIGWAPMPVAHGMTVGELATMANDRGWLKNGIKAKLTVIKMEGWKRTLWFDDTNLKWIKPSPNMATMRTAVVYPGTCFIEGTNVSEGRGSDKPFENIGAPWIDGEKLAKELNSYDLAGVRFEAIDFTPVNIDRMTTDPKYREQSCHGVYVNVTERNIFEPVRAGVAVLSAIHKLFPEKFEFRDRRIHLLAGTPKISEMILRGKSLDEIVNSWKEDVKEFKAAREKSLLY